MEGKWMDDLQKHMQLHACIDALRSYQKILEETIGRMMNLLETFPEGEVREKFVNEIRTVDVTADAMKWAVQMMESQGLIS